MKDKGFSKLRKSDTKLFGPRAILGYGFSPKAQTSILELFARLPFISPAPIFVHDESLSTSLMSLLQSKADKTQPTNTPNSLKQTMLLSGLTEQEVHTILTSWNKAGFPRPLWAVLTPVSQDWTLRSLIMNLQQEEQSFKKR